MTALRSVLLFVALLVATLPGARAASYPTYDHVVIVVEENHGYSQIVGDTTDAPYINGLLASSAVFSNYFAVGHPSEPNYFALYAGSTFGILDDGVYSEADPSQYTLLNAKSKTFKGYIETGSPQKHNPWESFPEGTSVEANFSTWPTSNYANLPNVAWVVPNLTDDMHDGTIAQGDTWLKNNIDGYLQWAKTHNSLLIVVWDEDDSTGSNQVLAFAAGAHITPGTYSTALNHYGLLGTVQSIFGATAPRSAATATLLPTTAFNLTSKVVAPLTGTVTKGTWVTNQSISVAAMPSGSMRYNYLLPQGYDPNGNTIYPIVVYGHENDEGMNGSTYPADGGGLVNQTVIDGTFNTVAFRTNFPAIVIVPEADQSLDLSGANGNANFGGYADTPNSGGNEQAVVALTKYFLANFKADPTQVYCTGDSLGAIGCLAWMVDNNSINGINKLFTAGMAFSDQLYRPGGVSNSTVFAAMKTVPLLAISTPNDNNQASYDQPGWTYYTGNSVYPTATTYSSKGVAGLKASTSNFYYLDTTTGVPWDTYRQLNADGGQGTALYTWLFSNGAGATPGTGKFTISNGQIHDPQGRNWIAHGINVYDSAQGSVSTDNTGKPLTTLFPGINFIRLATYQYSPASYFQTFIDQLTALGIVVEIEHHSGAGGGVPPLTGTALTDENTWFATLAAAFKDNPYVWFGTLNEPSGPGTDLSAEQLANYNAIRGAKNDSPIMMEPLGDYNTGVLVVGDGHGLVTADYANMVNIIWDFHYYDGLPDFNATNNTNSYSTDPKIIAGLISSYISQCQTIQSKDGIVPVLIGEYGPATDGQNNDPGGYQTVAAVEASGVGSAAWNWASGAPADNLTDGSNNLTTPYGSTVAAWIKTNTSGGEGLTLNSFGPEPQNTPFTIAGNINGVTAAPVLQYQDNGGAWAALPAGATVTSTGFSFVHPGMTANAAAKIAIRDANNTAISVVSPAFVVAGAASPNNTVVTTVGPAITDASGNSWTLTAGGQVAVNGVADTTTSGVIELAFVSGDVWQENNQNLWWYKTSPSAQWLPTSGTTVSPLPQGGSEALTIATINTQTAGATFTVTGTISGVTTVPVLQYQDSNGIWQNLTGSTAGTRAWQNQPGGNNSAWNLAFGKDATWGLATDLDTIDIARGWNGTAYTAGPVGVINPPSSYGQTSWVGKSTDSTVTFSSTNNGRTQSPDNGATITATVHLPTGAYAPGPYPADNNMVIEDPTSYPGRQYTFGGVNLQPPGFQAGQGPFTASAGEWDDATSDLYGEDQETGLNGYNLGAGLITGCDVDSTCNPSFPKIKHGLRYSTDAHLLKTNDIGDGSTLKPDSWPQRLQDGQSGINVYSGNLKAGTTLGIPSTTVMPTGLDANCQGLFWTFQHYPLFWRDQAGGGFHLSDDQNADGSAFITSARGCLPQLVGLLRPLRNQHQGGQSFTTNPANGPGTPRLDAGAPGLIGTGSVGNTTTTTAYTFSHPALTAGAGNTISIRDAANPSVVVTSNAFSVAAAAPESYAVNPIATQTAGAAFTVTGSISGDANPPTLQYQDSGGAWLALPSGSTVTATSFTFTNPGLAATSSATVAVRNANATSITATSNTFSVTATPVESVSIAAIAGQRVGTSFSVTGTVANAPAGLTLQYEDNGGAWQALPAGSSITGAPGTASFSFINPAPSLTNPSATVGVRDASATSVNTVSNAFAILPATSPNNTIVTTVGPAVVDASGESFTITTAGQVAVNGVADTSTANVKVLAYVSGTVWYENAANLWFGKTVAANAWAPPNGTLTSPLSTETLAINTVGPQTQNVAFSIAGVITSAIIPPTLQYQVNGGTWQPFPATSSVTIASFAVVIPGITTTGATTIAVRDAANTAIVATSNSFNVGLATGEVLTIQPIGNHPVGATFAVSGSISGLTAAPALQYQDNGGAWMPLPTGSSVTSAGYNFVHPGLPASQSMVIAVRDANNPGVVATAPAIVIQAQESPNLSVVTTQGPQIVDSFGIPYTLTAGSQVAINGVPDTTTSNVIELAYVNRQVWYENANLDWWSRTFAGAWGPTGGTLLGPLPSSKPTVYLTSSKPLAVVPGFTIAVPGVVINDTVISGNFALTITAVDGVLTMPGATGSGSAKLTMTAALSGVNNSLKQLQFTGKTVGTGSVTILVVDPAGIAASASVPVKVPRAAAAATPGQ